MPVPKNARKSLTTGIVIPDDVAAASLDELALDGQTSLDAREASFAAREAALAQREAALNAAADPTRSESTDADLLANAAQLAPVGMPKMVSIMIEEGGDEIPPTGLPVSLNGKAYLIRPGEPVSVPPGVVEILRNAIMSVPVQDPQTKRVVGYKNRLRHPFRLLSGLAA